MIIQKGGITIINDETFKSIVEFFNYFTTLDGQTPEKIKIKEDELLDLFIKSYQNLSTFNRTILDDFIDINNMDNISLFSEVFGVTGLMYSKDKIPNSFFYLIQEIKKLTSNYKTNETVLFFNFGRIITEIRCSDLYKKSFIMYYIILKIIYIYNKKNLLTTHYNNLLKDVYDILTPCNTIINSAVICSPSAIIDFYDTIYNIKENIKNIYNNGRSNYEEILLKSDTFKNVFTILENIINIISTTIELKKINLVEDTDYNSTNEIIIPKKIKNNSEFFSIFFETDKNPFVIFHNALTESNDNATNIDNFSKLFSLKTFIPTGISTNISTLDTIFNFVGLIGSTIQKYKKNANFPNTMIEISKEISIPSNTIPSTLCNQQIQSIIKTKLEDEIKTKCSMNGLSSLVEILEGYKKLIKTHISEVNYLSKNINYIFYFLCDTTMISDYTDISEEDYPEIIKKFKDCYNRIDGYNEDIVSPSNIELLKQTLGNKWNKKNNTIFCPKIAGREFSTSHEGSREERLNLYKKSILDGIILSEKKRIEEEEERIEEEKNESLGKFKISRQQRVVGSGGGLINKSKSVKKYKSKTVKHKYKHKSVKRKLKSVKKHKSKSVKKI